jgi:hypothetical protein
MNTRSLCAGAIRALLVSAAAAILAACAPPLDSRGEGNLRIVLAGGAPSEERAISPAIEATLSYKLYFSGPGEPFSEVLEPGAKSGAFTLSLGQWTIRAEAYTADGNLCGGGETPAPVTVAAGRTNDATIPMTAFADIAAFSLAGLPPTTIDPELKTIAVMVPFGADLTGLVPTIEFRGLTIAPPSGEARDFANPFAYTVTAANGDTAVWTVTVTVASNTAAAITAFSFATPPAAGIINADTKTIAVTVPFGTDVTGLAPTITASPGATIDPASGEAQDFAEPVVYTVTAEDGAAGQEWTVTVTIASNTANDITEFSFVTPPVTGIIDTNTKTIAVVVPFGADRNGLIPTIAVSPGATVSPPSGEAQNFNNTVEYIVTAGDGAGQQWTVTVTVASETAKNITGFRFNGLIPPVVGTIAGQTIAATVPYGTDRANLVPTISFEGSDINPKPGTAQDFNSPVLYTVIAADGSTATWAVTVTIAAPSAANDIVAFSIAGLSPMTINQAAHTVTLTVPYGTTLTGLIPTIALSPGATVSPASGVAQNFDNTITYTVTAQSGAQQPWAVMVATIAPSAANDIETFSIAGLPPMTIDRDAHTVTLTVPYGTTLTGLIPTIALSPGATVNPASGVAQNFDSTITYTVTAQNGSPQPWTVTITKPSALNTIALIQDYLASATGGASVADPVSLPVTLNLADTGGNGWVELLGAIGAANKYVALDLSVCTMTGMTGTAGEFDPDYTISAGKDKIVSLVFPYAAKRIKAGISYEDRPFQYFIGLTSVTGNYLTDVGDYAFYVCASLTSVNLPAVVTLGSFAFSQCFALTTVSFPASLTSIGYAAFVYCPALTTVDFPGVTSIGGSAFEQCFALASVSLPASLISIDGGAFVSCTNLTTITVDPENLYYSHSSDEKMLLSKDGKTLITYPSATGVVTLPSTITSIDYVAFAQCTTLTSVSLPAATVIGGSAFRGCTGLTTVSLPVVTSIDTSAFYDCTGETVLTVTLGATVPTLGMQMFLGVDSPKTVTVKVPAGAGAWTDGIIVMGDSATYSGADTTDNWGNGFRGGGWSFGAMTNDDYVNPNIALTVEFEYLAIGDVPAYLASAPGGASLTDDPVFLGANLNFSGSDWTNLLSAINSEGKYVALDLSPSAMSGVVFDPGTTSAGKDLIVSLVLPDAVGSIKSSDTPNNPAFRYFDNLESVAGEGITAIGDYAFYNCTGLKWMGLELPGVLTIGAYAFYGCTGLLSVEFGAVTNIGNDAFSGCANLSRADFPEAADIGNYAFSGCAGLSWTDFSEVVTIGNYAFYNCAGLVEVNFPEATDILDAAFSRCASLETIYLPKAESIGVGVFRDTGGQALEITLGDTAPTLGTDMFINVSSKVVTVNIPAGATTSYDSASYNDTNISANTWWNGFRGGGWNGAAITGATTDVNPNISLTFVTY